MSFETGAVEQVGKNLIVLFFAIVILGSLCSESAIGEPSKDSDRVTGSGGDFILAIESPIQNETINGSSVNLNFSVNDTGLLLLVRSISYMVCLDGEIYNQTHQTINNKTLTVLDETLLLQNVTKGQHTIKVNVTIDYDFYSISCGGPLDSQNNVSGSVDFFVFQQEKDLTVEQLVAPLTVAAIVGAVAIVVTAIILLVRKSMK